MSSVDTRNVGRDSLFLFAQLTLDGQAEPVRVKVRNLSAGGMMAEAGGMAISRGDRVGIELRNVGTIKGNVAWTQDDRFGVAFETEIDPKIVRAPVGTPRPIRPPICGRPPPHLRFPKTSAACANCNCLADAASAAC